MYKPNKQDKNFQSLNPPYFYSNLKSGKQNFKMNRHGKKTFFIGFL